MTILEIRSQLSVISADTAGYTSNTFPHVSAHVSDTQAVLVFSSFNQSPNVMLVGMSFALYFKVLQLQILKEREREGEREREKFIDNQDD